MSACLERAGLVTGKRIGPVCGPLWVLKLCLGAFHGALKPNNIHRSEIKELLDRTCSLLGFYCDGPCIIARVGNYKSGNPSEKLWF